MKELKLETEWITLFKGILNLMSYTGWNAGKAMEALGGRFVGKSLVV